MFLIGLREGISMRAFSRMAEKLRSPMDSDSGDMLVFAFALMHAMGPWAIPYTFAGVATLIGVQRHDRRHSPPPLQDLGFTYAAAIACSIVAIWPLVVSIAIAAMINVARERARYKPLPPRRKSN